MYDDEVSTVLRHFRPRPGFASGDVDHRGLAARTRHRKQRYKQGGYDRQFSGIKYEMNDEGGTLKMTYLHVYHHASRSCGSGRAMTSHIFLTFELAVATRQVKCVSCHAPGTIAVSNMKSRLDNMCDNIMEDGSNTTTLFFVVSKLLQMLNGDFPTYLFSDATKPETLYAMVNRFSRQRQKQFPKLRNAASSIHPLVDLQTLLMRCAAAGRNSSQVCAPVPVEFSSAVEGNSGDCVNAMSHLVLTATNALYVQGFRKDGDELQNAPIQQQKLVRDLLPYLLSLPWVDCGRLKAEKLNSHQKGITVGKLTLDIGSALGDDPAFSHYAAKYGTIQVFHGTKIDNAWSILNHGLVNLSYNSKLSQHGAMMGDGVYLSSSRQVAELFAISAAKRPPSSLASAFQHEALLHLLHAANVDVSILDPLENYNICCLPVFEAIIIKPPLGKDGRQCEKDVSTIARQEGKYFVCECGEYVRITALHLRIELSERFSVWQYVRNHSPLALSCAVMILAFFLMTR